MICKTLSLFIRGIIIVATSMLTVCSVSYAEPKTDDDFLGIRLHGTIISDHGSRLALISISKGQQTYFRKNSEIMGSIFLYDVYPRYIIIKTSTRLYRLNMSNEYVASHLEEQDPSLKKGQSRHFHPHVIELSTMENNSKQYVSSTELAPGQDRLFGDVPSGY